MTLVALTYRGVDARGEYFLLFGNLSFRVEAGDGDDLILANSPQPCTLFGDGGSDLILGGPGNGTIFGDTIATGPGGNDVLLGGGGSDTIFGGGGDDQIDGQDQADGVDGGDGNDIIWGGQGADALVGGTGDDWIFGTANTASSMSRTIDTTHDGLTDVAANAILGTTHFPDPDDAADDWINGEAGNDTLFGQGGNDTLLGGADNDAIAGGDGTDFISGNDGADILFGEAGSDLITGGAGSDTLRGGLGGDLFAFGLGDQGDLILNFNEEGVRDGFDLRPLFDATGYTGTTPRAAGILQVLQNGADTDVYIYGTFFFRIQDVTAAAIDDTYFLFQ